MRRGDVEEGVMGARVRCRLAERSWARLLVGLKNSDGSPSGGSNLQEARSSSLRAVTRAFAPRTGRWKYAQ